MMGQQQRWKPHNDEKGHYATISGTNNRLPNYTKKNLAEKKKQIGNHSWVFYTSLLVNDGSK